MINTAQSLIASFNRKPNNLMTTAKTHVPFEKAYVAYDFKALLQKEFQEYLEMIETRGNEPVTDSYFQRQVFICEKIFGVYMYDGELASMMAVSGMGAFKAITDKTTFEYIKDPQQYKDFMTWMNMEFFETRTNYGCSPRGAWWDAEDGDLDFFNYQMISPQTGHTSFEMGTVTPQVWMDFAKALIAFFEELQPPVEETPKD